MASFCLLGDTVDSAQDLHDRARRRIACRLLPFIFFLYLTAMIDRFNVSFAALRMKGDLGFSDSIYGLGASLFFVTYVLFEIPGAIVAERWSVRKWTARIMLSWGVITIFTACIHTAREFYVARLLLGTAEASFFPGIIIYLTRWFTVKDRARAIAAFYAASPISAFVGSALAGWLLPIHWMGLSGWRWLFVVEGLPAVVLGAITLFYLTDYPAEAGWLPEAERAAIVSAIAGESVARAKHGSLGFGHAWRDSRLVLIATGYFFYILGLVTNTLWMPTFLQRLSNLPPATVARFVMLPAAAGVAGLLLNSWSADKSGEHKWHAVIPLLAGGCCYLAISVFAVRIAAALLLFTLFYLFTSAAFPSIWAMPTMFLSEATAAAAFGLINSIGQMGGFFGPSIVGFLNDKTHSIRWSMAFIAFSLLASAFTLSLLKSVSPIYSERLDLQGIVAFEPDATS
jgi:MFS transporter, ACS family, tartrate transporter